MKLDTSKIIDNVAIHCSKLEYVRPLFEAMRWEEDGEGVRVWNNSKEKTCFECVGLAWGNYTKEWYEQNSYTIIPFEDLIIPEESNLAKEHNTGCEYCKESGSLIYHNSATESMLREVYIELDGSMTVAFWSGDQFDNESVDINFCPMCGRRIWALEQQRNAEKDLACSAKFKYVTKDAITTLWCEKPEWDNENKWYYSEGGAVKISNSRYPSLQPGDCESLEEIAGGGE